MLPGGQATAVAVPAADFQMLRIPEGMDDESALLLTDNLSTGWAGAQRADVPPGGTVAVIGLGAVGLCAVRSALTLGAARVLAVDPVAGRRDRAVESGAEAVEGPTVEALLEATGGLGVDAVIDAVAKDVTLDAALAAVRPGGTVSVIGVHDLEPYPLPALMTLFRSVTLRMTTAPVHRTWAELVPLVRSGRLRTDGIFTHRVRPDGCGGGLCRRGRAQPRLHQGAAPALNRPGGAAQAPGTHRCSRRRTTRRAVQVASTAQTLLSTGPRARASSRTT